MARPVASFSAEDTSRIIEMAWEDRTPFEAIELQFALNESGVVAFMRQQLKSSSFRMWRKRMAGRVTKHLALRSPEVTRAHCPTQYKRQY
jgi:uncharacterized protein (TIGR03643 family)